MAGLDDPKRLEPFRGSVVDLTNDEVLESCVAQACELAGAPIGLVSYVMAHVQFFRTGRNLPPELEVSRATARCHSYCQFVVQSESPLVLNDITARPDMPQTISQAYGIHAYCGVPVYCEGQLLGSLCVVDPNVREWGDELITQLTPLAARVSARLDELAAADRQRAETARRVEPEKLAETAAFGARAIERALAEVGPMVRLAGAMGTDALPPEAFIRGATALQQAVALYKELVFAARDVSEASEVLVESFEQGTLARRAS